MIFQASEDHVKVMGRTVFRDGIRYLGYSASAISFRFTGTAAFAVLISDGSERIEQERAWAAVFINDRKEPQKRFRLDQAEQRVELYRSEVAETVTITLMKYSEAEFAPCGIRSIEIQNQGGEEILLPPPGCKMRRIEIFGDSITCGYGVEGTVEVLEFTTAEENPMKSYSMLTARELDAEVQLVAWNGKGVITEYVGEESEETDDSWLMPFLYPYTDAGLERDYFQADPVQWEKWNFRRFVPDLIIVNLGTNDASYTRQIPERDQQFIRAYVKMLGMIHQKNPEAAVLCTLGTMDQRLCPAVEKAVALYQREEPDMKIRFLHLPMQEDADGLGTFWHPTETTQRKTADRVVTAIKEMMNWE